MNCDAAQDLLLDHAEGCLEAPRAEELEKHLKECASCRLALQQTRELVRAMFDVRVREENASKASGVGKAPAELSGWQPGSRLGDFEILGELGRGGMGIVYRARQVSLNRMVALKVLPGMFRQVESAVTRFKKEAQAAAKLHHTNIVPVYAQGEHEGHYYYAMKLVDGDSLDRILRKDPLHVMESLSSQPGSTGDSQVTASITGRRGGYRYLAKLVAGVAEGLEHAHKQGVIHRDIKPQNLLLAGDGQLHITDFGLARLLDEPSITMTGEMVGTPAYMSPEQVAGDRKAIDHRTDIFSLGVTFYELLTGSRPFEGAGRDQVVARILTREPKPPRKINPHVPLDLETICLRAMEKEPGRRYATAGAMAADLRRFADDRPIVIRRAGPVERVVKWVRRHPALTTIYALAAVLAMVTTIWRVQSARERHAKANELVRQAYSFLAYDDYSKPKEAIARLKEAAALGPDDWEYRRALGLASLHDDPKKAIEELTHVVSARPNDADAYCLLAWAQRLQADRVDGAVKQSLERAESLGGPQTAEGHFFKGQVLIREMDAAEEEFRRACELHPNYTQAILHLGRSLNHWMYHNRKHDKFGEQVRHLEHACDLQPKRAYPRYLLSIAYRLSGEIYEELGDGKSAEPEYANALKYAREGQQVEPESARGYVAEAEYWETKRDYPKALEFRNRSDPYCTKPEPRAELYQYRWRLHFWLGHHDEALKDLQALAALRDDTDPKRAWYRGLFPALVQADQGKIEEAVATVLAVVREQPQSFRATTAAASFLRMVGRTAESDHLLLDNAQRIRYEPAGSAEVSSDFMKAAYQSPWAEYAIEKPAGLQNEKLGERLTDAVPSLLSAVALMRDNRALAFQRFRRCDAAYDSEDYCYLARVFVRKMELDPRWRAWTPSKP